MLEGKQGGEKRLGESWEQGGEGRLGKREKVSG